MDFLGKFHSLYNDVLRRLIALFAGCGGTSCGFAAAGFELVCAVDCDKPALESYKLRYYAHGVR